VGSKRKGRFAGLPYDRTRPTPDRVRERAWNPDEPRVLLPKAVGWGYSINPAGHPPHAQRDGRI
jgi:hypothetical protein